MNDQSLKRHTEKLPSEETEKKRSAEISGIYFLKSYLSGFIITACAFFIFYWTGTEDYTALFILSFILYPFSKVFYDALIGFSLPVAKEEKFIVRFLSAFLQLAVHLLLYLSSLYLAPFGVLYLIFRFIYRFFQNRMT